MTAASRKETAMWLLERLVPGTGVNNVTVAFEVDGRVDRAELTRALGEVVAKHEILRTVFTADDTTLTKAVLAPEDAAVVVADIPDQDAFVAAPFTLDGTLLVRAGVRDTATTSVCCVVVHHLVFDAMSTTILLNELIAAYEGRLDPTPVPPLAEREPNDRSVAYWQKSLDGLRASESGLWCAKPQGATATLRADTVYHTLSPEARDAVARLQKELRASEAVILLAAYSVLLTQHGAGSDVVIGTPVNVRDQRSMNAIGYHANLLPLRVRLDEDADFRKVVKKTRSTFLEAISHADVPQEQVSPSVIGDQPSSWRSSFFRHLFNYVPGTVDESLTIAGMPLRHLMAENGFSRFDLEFFIMPGPDETRVRAAFCVDAFAEADVRLLLERYDALLAGLDSAVDTPVAELSRWGATDRAVLGARDTVDSAAAPTVPESVHAAVTRDPDAVAIEEQTRVVTYGELWSAAVATRDVVTQAGATTVALIAPRGADLAAAWLGAWLAGAACVLLDPAQPPADLSARATDSGATLVLIEPGLPVPGGVPIPAIGGADRLDAPDVDRDALAYLEYPLDATEPVAVTVSHRALAAAVAQVAGAPAVTLWLSSVATNASLIELLVALTAGGRAVVSPDRARVDGQVLGDLLERHQIGLVQAPAAVWRLALEQAGGRLAGRTVLTGPDETVANQLRAADAVVRTGYTTQGVAGYATLAGAFITEPGTSHEVGIGVRGELCVGGPAVAAGYHGRPDLTEARFIEHPAHGRCHRTGDLAHWRADGSLAIDGPISAHVTIAGQRVHLSQVETALAPHVDAVAAIGIDAGDEAGIVVFAESRKPGIAEVLREHARTAMPGTPAIIVLDRLPLTLASTVDRAALRAMADAARSAPADGPEDETTAGLVAIWRDLLGNPTLHAESNFFTSGGHSLLGAQLVQRVKKDLDIPVQLADLFANPTPRGLAAELENAMWDEDDEEDDDWD